MGGRLRGWRAGRARVMAVLEGAITILAFSESGRMRRLRLPKRLLAIFVLTLLALVTGSTISIVTMFRGQVDLARIAYLERENRSLVSLLEGQAEHLSRLKLEVDRLKEFEQNLRVVSGLDSQTPPPPAATNPGQTKREKKR